MFPRGIKILVWLSSFPIVRPFFAVKARLFERVQERAGVPSRAARKAAMVKALKDQEDKSMKIFSIFELENRKERELAGLFREVSQFLPRTERGSAERRNALASLENINQARAARHLKGGLKL